MGSLNVLVFALAIFTVFLQHTSAIKLDSDGGYSIVIALEPNTPDPPLNNTQDYIFEIWDTLEFFSAQMFAATDGTFYLKQVDLLLPTHWTLSAANSTSQSYETADVRLTSQANAPYVENPNACGIAGNYIELPLEFLNSTLPQRYGPPSKALLNLWARLRYGVWEEHGEHGNTMFPYFYKKSGFSEWEATGCSNTKLEGTFRDSNGNSCESVDGAKPSDDCIFHPSLGNRARSSLMTYQWLSSTTQFCNDDNHNKDAPNPQNLFCRYQSVWGVIQSTADYAKVTNKVSQVPALEINIVKKRELPSLYILLEHGEFVQNKDAGPIITAAVRNLVTFLGQDGLQQTVVRVGTYSTDSAGLTAVATDLPWVLVYDHLDAIYEALGNVKTGPANRDLGTALMGAINDIGAANSQFQSALLVLKTGRFSTNYGSSVPEEDILQAFKKTRTTLYAIELEQTTNEFPRQLQGLAESTGGVHVPLKTRTTVDQVLQPLLNNLTEFLGVLTPSTAADTVVFKGRVQAITRYAIPFRPGMDKNLKFHLTVISSTTPNIAWTQNNGTISTRAAFGEGEVGVGNKTIYTVTPVLDLSSPIDEFFVQYTCGGGFTCVSDDLLITYTSDTDLGITASVSVGAVENYVDFGKPSLNSLAPFAIYAKIEQNGKPVRNLMVVAKVSALNRNSVPYTVTLEDNGQGVPDVLTNDGVYSGVFIPYYDGAHKISVEVQYKKTRGKSQPLNAPGTGRLLPEDQNKPVREVVELDVSYASVVDYSSNVVFVNVTSIELTRPNQILDLSAKYLDEKETQMEIIFTSPKLLGGTGKASKYILQGAKSIDTLIYSTSDVRSINNFTEVKDPGQPERFVVSLTESLSYYQILTVAGGGSLDFYQPSNIVQVEKANIPTTTTATPPTDSTPTPTTSRSTPSTRTPPTNPPTETPTPLTSTRAAGVRDISSVVAIFMTSILAMIVNLSN